MTVNGADVLADAAVVVVDVVGGGISVISAITQLLSNYVYAIVVNSKAQTVKSDGTVRSTERVFR